MLDEIHDVDNVGYVPAYLTHDRIEGRFQQRYELMLKRRKMAGIYHTSHRQCKNHQTVLNLQAKGIGCNHLKRYILAHKCDACDAAPGRRQHKVKATTKSKRKNQVNFKDSSASSDSHHNSLGLAKSTYRTPRFGIQHNYR